MKTIGEIFEETNSPYLIIEVREFENWSDNIKEKLADAFTVYFIKNEPTHICSAAVNYPTRFLYNNLIPKSIYDDNDEVLDEMWECNNDNGGNEHSYIGEYVKLLSENYHIPTKSELGDEETTEEEIWEYFLCNHAL